MQAMMVVPFVKSQLVRVSGPARTRRRRAIIETVFADLIDGPIAHLPSGRFPANSAWTLCTAITHNLPNNTDHDQLRAATTPPGRSTDSGLEERGAQREPRCGGVLPRTARTEEPRTSRGLPAVQC